MDRQGRKTIICITLVLIFVLCSFALAYANQYEYNDVRIYIGGVYKTTIALKTDVIQGANSYFFIFKDSNNKVGLQNTGGQTIWTSADLDDSGYNYFRTVTATQNSNPCNIDMSNSAQPVVAYSTSNLYAQIYLYINSPQTQLAAPVLSVSGSTISWSPVNGATGYNIQYARDNVMYETIVTNYSNTSYQATASGKYLVQAIDETGTYLRSNWSTSVEVNASSGGNLLDYLTSIFAQLKTFFLTATESISSIFGTIGTLIRGVADIFPTQVSTFIYSCFIAICCIAIIKHFL